MKQIQNNTTRNGKITWSRKRNSNKIRNKTNTRRSTRQNNEVNRRKLPNENYKPKVHLTDTKPNEVIDFSYAKFVEI